MKPIITFFAVPICMFLCLTASCSSGDNANGCHDGEIAAALCQLDSVIAGHDADIRQKERRIDSLKMLLPGTDVEQRYDLYDRVFGEYYSYDLDSAAAYASRKAETARLIGDRGRIAASNLNLARMRLSQGRIHEAVEAMTLALPDTVYPAIKRQWYDFMASYDGVMNRDPLKWHERMRESLDSASPAWIYNECNLLWHKGNLAGAAQILEENRRNLPANPHNEAITNYLLGEIYLQRRDTAEAVRHITLSAINDLRTPVRDYKSLYELASLLLVSGDVERAYRYIDLAVEDANAANAFDNMVAVSRIMPQIVRAHDRQVEQEQNAQRWFAAVISLLALCLVMALVLTVRSRNLAGKAAAREKDLNKRLMETNRELEAMNLRILESNKVKDAYLVQYFNLCSYFVGRFEEFRGSVSSTARTKGLAGVEKLIAASDDDRELKKFYSNFDSTFLSLFPGFIENFNKLIAADKQVSLNRDGSMSNELRTFALIRLGIVDSDQIAGFLRRSVSTIYNYRVKMRNAAICPRDEFEEKVREIRP